MDNISFSDTIGKLSEALALAQSQFKPVVKSKDNPFFKSKYADLSMILDATQDALSANGLSLLQFPTTADGRAHVTSILVHKSGEWMNGTLSLKLDKDTPQGAGSAITYARRYSAEAILGISATDDDDGEAAMNRDGKPKEGPRKNEEVRQPAQLVDANDPAFLEWLTNKLKTHLIPLDLLPVAKNLFDKRERKDVTPILNKFIEDFITPF